MPNKTELAGPDNSAPEARSKRDEESAVAGNRVVAEMVRRIEAMLSLDSPEPSILEENRTEKRARSLCHVSISYIRSHAATSIDIFWRESIRPKDFYVSSRTVDKRRFLRVRDL